MFKIYRMFHRKQLYRLIILYILLNFALSLSSNVLNNQSSSYSSKIKEYHSENVAESHTNGIFDLNNSMFNYRYDGTQEDFVSISKLVAQAEIVHSKLKQILSDYYFRIYRVNLDTKCLSRPRSNSCSSQKKFISLNKASNLQNMFDSYVDNHNGSHCYQNGNDNNSNSRENGSGIQKCHVDRCNSTDIPFNMMHSRKEHYVLRFSDGSVNKELISDLDLSEPCENTQFASENYIYVDLLRNPPSYTGYNGQDDWKFIYNEINRIENISCKQNVHIYKLISGIQATISAFSSLNYECVNPLLAYENQTELPRYQSNYQFYVNKLSKYKDRIENIYYTYKYVLAAVVRLEQYLASYSSTLQLVNNTLYLNINDFVKFINKQSTTTSCDCRFTRYGGYSRHSDDDCCKIIDASCGSEVFDTFQKIIQIVDCVDCEKCRLHGKLKVASLLMSVKILSTPVDKMGELELDRNDLVALLHGLDYLAQSVLIVDKFEQHRKRQYILYPIRFLLGTLLIFTVIYRREIFSFRFKKHTTTRPLSVK